MVRPDPVRVPLLAAVLLIAGVLPMGCGEVAEAPPKRIHLFDLMEKAEITGIEAAGGGPSEPRSIVFDFDGQEPERIWYGRAQGEDIDYEERDPSWARIAPAAGLEGGGLRLGPGLPEDLSLALIVVPAAGLSRIRISGRVRLDNNPMASEASSREVLRVIEHASEVEDPTRKPRWFQGRPPSLRISRRIDPSGWDRFEVSFISEPDTRSLEIQMLHRSGGSGEAVTRFDDLEIEEVPLSPGRLCEEIRDRYRPRDGREAETPWRLRVELRSLDGRHMEARDALLLPPPGTVFFPVFLPAPETRPRLRFLYAMTEEAYRAEGDGARIEVSFQDESGEAVPVGEVEFDPKNNGKQRAWLHAAFDLTPMGGRKGRLAFSAKDIPGSEQDWMDTVLLSSPRIEPAGEPAGAFNILLIGVDTLRADRLSALGYGRATTPNLEALADHGIRFTNARSQAPWTLPSFSSILTSLYPSAHGAGRGGHDEWTPIDPSTISLAEVLGRLGYETQGFVASGLISPRYGLDQGFEAYRSSWIMESAGRDAPAVVDFIENHRNTPWFFFWHIMDPHLPYTTEARFREGFTDAAYQGRFRWGGGSYVPFQALDPRPGRRWFTHEGPPPLPNLSESDRRFVSDYYDAEIAETDQSIGKVLDALKAGGLWEHTIVALIADHGEGLGDHDHYHHGYTLFEDQVRVPMLLRIPGRHEGRVIDRPVAAIDLAPTILGALGIEPPDCFQGVDRLAEEAVEGDAYFIEYPTYDSSAQKAWVEGGFKYLHDPVFRTEALYLLDRDPAERENVVAEYPEVAARARAALDAFRWEQLQKGRFHLRVRGESGRRLQAVIGTDDLFDANFACRPSRPEQDFEMDLERRHLQLDTVLESDRLELVFWCRGSRMTFDLRLDGEPLNGGLAPGGRGPFRKGEARIERGDIPVLNGKKDLAWPGQGEAFLWLESGAAQVMPVVPTPEEIEHLRRLGYAR